MRLISISMPIPTSSDAQLATPPRQAWRSVRGPGGASVQDPPHCPSPARCGLFRHDRWEACMGKHVSATSAKGCLLSVGDVAVPQAGTKRGCYTVWSMVRYCKGCIVCAIPLARRNETWGSTRPEMEITSGWHWVDRLPMGIFSFGTLALFRSLFLPPKQSGRKMAGHERRYSSFSMSQYRHHSSYRSFSHCRNTAEETPSQLQPPQSTTR